VPPLKNTGGSCSSTLMLVVASGLDERWICKSR